MYWSYQTKRCAVASSVVNYVL